MENNLCLSHEKVEELIQSLQQKNSYYSRETIIKAIEQCCKNKKEPLDFKSMEECVAFFASNYHLNK